MKHKITTDWAPAGDWGSLLIRNGHCPVHAEPKHSSLHAMVSFDNVENCLNFTSGITLASSRANSRCTDSCSFSCGDKNHIHTTHLLYKERTLAALGIHTAARDFLTMVQRRSKDRPAALLDALLYERAGVYEALGQGARARGDLEKVYAADPR